MVGLKDELIRIEIPMKQQRIFISKRLAVSPTEQMSTHEDKSPDAETMLDDQTQSSEGKDVKKSDESLQLGKNLRALKASGVSFAHLARESKIAKATIHSWANDVQPTDLAAVKRLAAALNKSVHTLLWGTEDPISKVSIDSTRLQELFSGRFVVDLTLKKIDEPKKE